MKIPQNPPKPNTPSADVATQQWVSTYYATKSALVPGQQIDYVQRTTNYTNATTGFTSVIDGNPISFDGATRVKIEFFSEDCELSGASVSGFAEVFDGSTDLCTLGVGTANSGAGLVDFPFYGAVFLTPSVGVHTYHIKARCITAGSITFAAGPGTGGGSSPAWYRITKA